MLMNQDIPAGTDLGNWRLWDLGVKGAHGFVELTRPHIIILFNEVLQKKVIQTRFIKRLFCWKIMFVK